MAPGTGVGGAAATATTAPPDSVDAASAQNEQTRQDLELKLQELIECLLELSITVYDFQAESNLLVHQKMYGRFKRERRASPTLRRKYEPETLTPHSNLFDPFSLGAPTPI